MLRALYQLILSSCFGTLDSKQTSNGHNTRERAQQGQHGGNLRLDNKQLAETPAE